MGGEGYRLRAVGQGRTAFFASPEHFPWSDQAEVAQWPSFTLTRPSAHGIREGVKRLRSRLVLAVFSGCVLAAALAQAAADGDSTESLLRTLESAPDVAAATADARNRAKMALERARRFRESGDEGRARIAEGLALRTAELARDQARTFRAERATADSVRAAEDAGAQLDRERALVEEGLAQSGRLRAQLEALEADRKREPERTATRVLNDAGTSAAPTAGSKPKGAAPKPGGGADGGAK